MTDIPRRTRYEVLRRDNYTCRYCGAKAPDVKLNVDAVLPRVLGGSHRDPANLVTACEACNGGKSSSAPDAPLVAEVSDRALEWSQAMRQAQAKMLADLEAREADRAQFQEWWDGWSRAEGDTRTLIPKDAAWWVTVDQLISAGLPLPVLKGCIDLAMTQRKVRDENRFRYMCGIAWNKVGEMNKAARLIASGNAPDADGADPAGPFEEGRLSLARELLGEMSDEERSHFLDSADVNEYLDEDEQRTEAEEACEAVGSALNSARCNLDWLVDKIRETLQGLPPEIGEPCLAEMRTLVKLSDPLARMAHEAWGGLLALEDLIDLPAATAWTYEVSDEERAEWLSYARALYLRAELNDERWLVRAWRCAMVVIAGGQYYTDMCRGRGEHIQDCPARGTHYALIAELGCCGPDRAEDHKGHLVCEHHLEQLMDGTFAGRSGDVFTATDFTEVPEDVWAAF